MCAGVIYYTALFRRVLYARTPRVSSRFYYKSTHNRNSVEISSRTTTTSCNNNNNITVFDHVTIAPLSPLSRAPAIRAAYRSDSCGMYADLAHPPGRDAMKGPFPRHPHQLILSRNPDQSIVLRLYLIVPRVPSTVPQWFYKIRTFYLRRCRRNASTATKENWVKISRYRSIVPRLYLIGSLLKQILFVGAFSLWSILSERDVNWTGQKPM